MAEQVGGEYAEIERAHEQMTKGKKGQKKATEMASQKRYRYGVPRRVRRARSA